MAVEEKREQEKPDMKKKKIFVLLPDGVGLRNFAYTNFYKLAEEREIEVVYWNNSALDLSTLGLAEIKMQEARGHIFTDVLKKARVRIDLNRSIRKFHDPVYKSYRFKFATDSPANIIKAFLIRVLTFICSSDIGVELIRKIILQCERKTAFYRHCREVLQKEKPDFVFCTNQRTTAALAPILAAEDSGIPTGTFIFSWDNLPKATLVLEPNYYFVWSEFMKEELMKYYSFIGQEQIFVTGTPQFEMHQDAQLLTDRETFYRENNLDPEKKYICYSGDDITTSPNDPIYLEDTAKAIMALNNSGEKLGIIFRRCPVDHSNRFDTVLKKYSDLIVPVEPKWQRTGDAWNTIIPIKEDMVLQINTIAHSEMVINLGSSMVFDYVTHRKACAYINYDIAGATAPDRTVEKIYDFVHFRSMPSREAVFWIDNPAAISSVIIAGMYDSEKVVNQAQKWFEIINKQPFQEASGRILEAVENIIRK